MAKQRKSPGIHASKPSEVIENQVSIVEGQALQHKTISEERGAIREAAKDTFSTDAPVTDEVIPSDTAVRSNIDGMQVQAPNNSDSNEVGPEKFNSPLPIEQMKVLCALLKIRKVDCEQLEGISGRALSAVLEKWRSCESYAAFYFLMRRLEKNLLIVSRTISQRHGPYKTREKYYRITDKGEELFRKTIRFYFDLAKESGIDLSTHGKPADSMTEEG